MHFTRSAAVVSAITLSSLVAAKPTPEIDAKSKYPGYIHPANGICTDYTVEQTVTYEYSIPNYPSEFKSNFDLVGLLASMGISPKVPSQFNPFSGSKNVTNTFRIAGTFCKPKVLKNGKESTVVIATHGAGFDRRYWASSFEPENYNFVQYALNAGNSVFYYDRAGVGLSSRVKGRDQEALAQVELLAGIAKAIKAGKYTSGIQPKKIALLGHSLGSALTTGALGKYPTIADAAIITGFAYTNPSTDIGPVAMAWVPSIWGSRLVSSLPDASKPQFADSFDDGWFGFADVYSYTEAFLWAGDVDTKAAQYSFSISQPTSVGELFTLGSAFDISTLGQFKGKVFLTPAERDVLLCDGDCKDTYAKSDPSKIWKGAEVSVYFLPQAGHGQSFAKNAKDLYAEITKFLDTL